ncbi:tyrosine protein phosphatase [Pontibacillus halophilus JSM 076056 = DSM 19796]|uniref:Tyrosine-protein phosphatase n=1 Tax=Pontibacillus halophilus JSM 076056 = DSM 19796 TaxID=1385510 RepID=A0A0A5GPF3_9BACI|nr:CpsB/CapC family capsule biosynthesis tyrosine phosphatase [Pontibacillus halophilus]KGX93015.1 tyrosine protein phosphatase [Pontibacillus halophilus JSM 076056 = DSM 19796]
MIEIHSHILPKLDDGAKDVRQTLEMGLHAVKNGVTHVIATPHHRNGNYLCKPEHIEQRVGLINKMFQSKRIPLKVLPGMEVHLYPNLIEDLTNNQLVSLNRRRYILVELPDSHIPHYTEELFYEMQLLNHIPIIAHPERNHEIRKHPGRLADLISRGALTQLTAGSVIGEYGRECQKYSHLMLKQHYAHFLSSDAHNVANRSFKLKEAYEYVEKHYSKTYVDYLQKNAVSVAKGVDFSIVPPHVTNRSFSLSRRSHLKVL